jgi:hypothetical protein
MILLDLSKANDAEKRSALIDEINSKYRRQYGETFASYVLNRMTTDDLEEAYYMVGYLIAAEVEIGRVKARRAEDMHTRDKLKKELETFINSK